MIKKALLLTIVVLMAVTAKAASTITQQQAKAKAQAFLEQRQANGKTTRRSSAVELREAATGFSQLYAFNAEGGGFVIVSADDSADGVLGYSLHGAIDQDDMPDNMKAWLQGYARQIKLIEEGKAQAARRASAPRERIEPLIKSQWGQREPYNRECPVDLKTGVRTITGCLATSMSQVMKYWKWPQGATKTVEPGNLAPSTTFDWENMLDTYTEGNYTEAQGNAVAHLMRWAGLTVKMEYGVNMSGALTILIDKALRDYFGYDKNVRWLSQVEYTIDDWEEMLYQELAAKRPIIYNGYNSSVEGHSFVCDGYDGEGKFHFNWGWNGKFDGFFQIPALDPVGSGDGGSLANPCWSDFHDVIIGIQPPTDDPAIETQTVYEGCERMYVYSDPVMTRPDTKSPFPEIRILRYLTTAHTLSMQPTYRYALLKDGKIHCMLNGRQYAELTSARIICINSFNCVLPDTLSDGNYRLVAMKDTGKEPDIKDVLRGSDRFYVNVNIDGTTLRLTEVPGEANLKLSNPEYEYEDFRGEQTVKTVTFTVENLSDEEYFGHLFVYTTDPTLWSYERCLLRPHETRKVKVVRRKTDYGTVIMKPDDQYGVYADMFYRHWLYGIKIDATPITLGPLTLGGNRVDNEKKIIKGSSGKLDFTIFNQSDKDYSGLFKITGYNVEDESENVPITTGSRTLPAGSSITFTEKLKEMGTWSKVRFSFRYLNNNDLFDECFTDVYTIVPVATALTPDSVETVFDDAGEIVAPEDATVVIIPQSKVKRVTPNKNPNTIYYVSNPSVEGLEHAIVLNDKGSTQNPVVFYTRYDMGFKNNIPNVSSESAGIVHTFTAEETNCWLPLVFFSDIITDEFVTDAVTGEDLSANFHYFAESEEMKDCGASKGELHVKPAVQRGKFSLVRVDPAMAGRTVKFMGDAIFQSTYFLLGSKLGLVYNYCRQTRKNVYILEGDSFVLHESYELKPFTFCLVAQENATGLPTSLKIVNDNDPTGISTAIMPTIDTGIYYDLQGRRITGKPAAGVYINNGKKIIIK